jgi:hypothetical protein
MAIDADRSRAGAIAAEAITDANNNLNDTQRSPIDPCLPAGITPPLVSNCDSPVALHFEPWPLAGP